MNTRRRRSGSARPRSAKGGLAQPPRKQRSSSQVREAFDPDVLARLCTLEDFREYAPRFDLAPTRDSQNRFLHYRNNDSNILAVAHLDSVQPDGTCTIEQTDTGPLVRSGTLDDRLGAYVILELLPQLGVTVDWLLTTDEELGATTAEDFAIDKPYNWMFQFDRGGTDVVMYDYETTELADLVRASGAKVGLGSFSDICALEHLGCAGFNWGVGYRDYHSHRSHAWLEDTFTMVTRFLRFYTTNKGLALPHTPGLRYWDDYGWSMPCTDCGAPSYEGICTECDSEYLAWLHSPQGQLWDSQ